MPRRCPVHIGLATLLFTSTTALCLGAAPGGNDHRLLEFTQGILESVAVTDSKVSVVSSGNDPALRIAAGQQQPWPGVILKAPRGWWDLSEFDQIALEVTNVGTNRVTVHCRIDNTGADGINHCVTDSLALDPGKAGTLTVRLKRTSDSTLDGKLFGMRGYPVAEGGPGTINPAAVRQLVIFLNKPAAEHVFEIKAPRARGRYVAPSAWITDADPFFPFIDTFGQYKHKSWPGKIHSLAGLEEQRTREAKDLAENPGPSEWNKFGGWAGGPQLKATGFFRTEKHAGKWWLVDPEGRLFFSQGLDCVRMREVTPIEERESWFEAFPGNEPEFEAFLAPRAYALKGHYAGRSPRSFSFAEANLLRKYGADWARSYPELIHRRLRSWGLNTIGMWSDQRTWLLRRTPYVDAIGSRGGRMIEGSEGYWGKFPDVWDPGFREGLQKSMAAKVNRSANDPWCIGYFADNEMAWGDETSLALGALRSPADQPAKKEFISALQRTYQTIDRLNAAWGTAHDSWDALLQASHPPDAKKAHRDLAGFYSQTAEQYFRTVRDVIKDRAPNQLYLGCRFAWGNPRAAAAAARFCDVVSYNLYSRSVADFQFDGGADVPLIIGEFHFGALDRGMFHTGLVGVSDQAARAEAYRRYVEGVLRHPSFVGCHWFQYQDEPTTGRVYDEENYQIGFVDIADTPYPEMIEASRNLGRALYRNSTATP